MDSCAAPAPREYEDHLDLPPYMTELPPLENLTSRTSPIERDEERLQKLNLIRLKLNLTQLMKTRGYKIPSEDNKNLQLALESEWDNQVVMEIYEFYAKELGIRKRFDEDIKDRFFNHFSMVYTMRVEKHRRSFYVRFAPRKRTANSFGVDGVGDFVAYIMDHQHTSGMLITEQDLSTQAKSQLAASKYEYMHASRLSYDALNHFLVVPHRILKPEEKAQLSREIVLSSLPRLPRDDIQCIYHGAKTGDIMEVIRRGFAESMADHRLIYRLVV